MIMMTMGTTTTRVVAIDVGVNSIAIMYVNLLMRHEAPIILQSTLNSQHPTGRQKGMCDVHNNMLARLVVLQSIYL
jgi:hypothetical protein